MDSVKPVPEMATTGQWSCPLTDGRDWFCTDSTDSLHNSCEAAEEEERDIAGTEGGDEEVDSCPVIGNLDS